MRLPEARRPSMRMCFSSRCQPRGRTTIVASSPSGFSAYDFPSSEVKSIIRSSASLRLIWPPIMLSHSGVLASSKSASQTFAPELRALIVIFRSVGPVISTRPVGQARRRRRDSPGRVLADGGRLGQEVQIRPAAEQRLAAAPRGEQLVAALGERVMQVHEQVAAPSG